MRPIVFTEVLAASSANCISVSQKPLAAGNLTITGSAATNGVATLDTARIVGIASDADDTAVTFTVYGTDANGNAMSETVQGPNTATASTVNNYLTVTRVAIDAASTGNITVGTTGVGASSWKPVDYIQVPFNIGFKCDVTGTVNYTVQHTFDDVFDPTVQPIATNHAFVAAQTSSQDGNYAFPVRAIRLQINSGSGSVKMTIVQGLGA